MKTTQFRAAIVASAAVVALASGFVAPAFADVAVPVSQVATVEELAVDIAIAARELCLDAQAAGEVDDVPACVQAVVLAAAEESGNQELIAYVVGNEPAVRQAGYSN